MKGANAHRLAAIGTTSTAALAPWHPNANSTVRALTLSPGGERIFAGGDFSRVNGIRAPTWRRYGWPVARARSRPPGVAGHGAAHGRQAAGCRRRRNGGHVALYASMNGARRWLAVTDGDVQGVAISGSTIIVGGHFNNFCVGGEGHGDPLVCNNPMTRRKLMALSLGEGVPNGWDPDVVGSPIGVSAVAAGGGGAQAGGAFTKVHGVSQQGFVRFR